VGGDYTKEQEAAGNAALTTDGGKTWLPVGARRPNGYRSCVAFLPCTRAPTLIAVGPDGSDYSISRGQSWKLLDSGGYHSASFAGRTGWAVGEGGRVARYVAGF
jgi:photosystem II stability/assembly factor-like uncharacterized protein